MALQRGFTMFEILVVMGIFVIVGGFALFVSMETYRGSNFRADRNLLVATLQRARAEAMNNICSGSCTDGEEHGVAIRPSDYPSDYVIFQTSTTYAGRNANDTAQDATFESNPTVTPSGATEVVFSQLTGDSVGGTITLTGSNGQTSAITITTDGQISWTN